MSDKPPRGEVVPIPPSIPSPPVFSTILTGGSLALAWLVQKVGLESILSGLVKKGSKKAWFCAMAAFFLYVNNYLGFITVQARAKFGVGHPLVYPSKEELNQGKGGSEADRITFICAVRGHENFHEAMATYPLVLMALAAYAKQPMTATMFGVTSAIGRILYSLGYSTGYAKARAPGFLMHLIPYNTAAGLLALHFVKKAF